VLQENRACGERRFEPHTAGRWHGHATSLKLCLKETRARRPLGPVEVIEYPAEAFARSRAFGWRIRGIAETAQRGAGAYASLRADMSDLRSDLREIRRELRNLNVRLEQRKP
jgi:hypothetical protein